VLLPLGMGECPLDILAFVTGLAARQELTVLLLHVINLNIHAPEGRVYRDAP